MKNVKTFDEFLIESVSRAEFQEIQPNDEITYAGSIYKVIGNDGFSLDLEDKDGKDLIVNYSQLKKFGNLSNPIKIILPDGEYWIKKIDSTHVSVSNSKKNVNSFVGHIEQYRNEPYYTDVKKWLKGAKAPHNKEYY